MPITAVENYKGVEVERGKNEEMQFKDRILEKVLEANDIEVPQNLVDDEVKMMVLEMNHRMKYESMASGGYIEFTQEDVDAYLEEFKAEAFKLVKTRLVLKGIIEAENLEVTKEELNEEAKAISLRQQMSIEMVKDFLGDDLATLKNDLLVRKAIDFVQANAVIK
jgi:trigger factor